MRKGQEDPKNRAIPPAQQPVPEVSHSASTSEHTPPLGSGEDIQAAREALRSSSRGGKSTLQGPASVRRSCQASAMCSCSCWHGRDGRRTEGRKNVQHQTLSSRQVGGLQATEAGPGGAPREMLLPGKDCHAELLGSQAVAEKAQSRTHHPEPHLSQVVQAS